MAKNLKPDRTCASVYLKKIDLDDFQRMIKQCRTVSLKYNPCSDFDGKYRFSPMVESLLKGWCNRIKKEGGLNELKLELLDKCPLSCKHCSSLGRPDGDALIPFDKAKEIIQEFRDLGGSRLIFSGGEPLLYKGLAQLVKYAFDLGIEDILLYTTGITSIRPINPVDKDTLSKLKKSGVSKLIYSIYSSIDEIHDGITGAKGSLKATLAAIRQSREIDLPVEAHFALLSMNYRSFPALAKQLAEMDVPKISILRFVPHGRGKDNETDLQLLKKQYQEFRRMVSDTEKKQSISIRNGSPMNFLCVADHERVECMAAVDRLCIIPTGKAFACDAFKNRTEDSEDDIFRKSLREIWRCSERLQYVRYIKEMAFNDKTECSGCSKYSTCGGGCLAQKILKGEQFYKPDPDCIMSTCKEREHAKTR